MNAWNGGMRPLFDWKLAKAVGLRQILDPGSARVCVYNAYHLALTFGLVLPSSTMAVLSLVGLYRWSNDQLAVTLYPAYAFQFMFSCGKIARIMHHSGVLWQCYESLATVRPASGNRGTHRHWRRLSAWLSAALVAMSAFVWFAWSACPYALSLTATTSAVVIKGPAGVEHKYRLNVYNLNFPFSDTAYNDNFFVFYCLELVVLTNTVYSNLLFDLIIVTMCSAICCQLQTVGDAIRMLGHGSGSQLEHQVAGEAMRN